MAVPYAKDDMGSQKGCSTRLRRRRRISESFTCQKRLWEKWLGANVYTFSSCLSCC